MKIFVRALPSETSPKALQAFAEDLLTPPWYLSIRPKIKVKSCTVLKIKDLKRNTLEFHGLLEVTSDKSAMKAIKRLNHTRFQGKLLEVRRWHERSALNDNRRSALDTGEEIHKGERRKRDRRRARLRIETYEPTHLRF